MSTQDKTIDQDEVSSQEDTISIPLYVTGLIVSILGILAVNSALSDTQFGSTTLSLTILGFIFSIGCRWLQINPRIVEGMVLAVCLYFGYRFFEHTISPSLFIPPYVSQGDLIMAIALGWLTVVRSWILTNDDSVVFTSVTSIAMIGLVGASDLNGELLGYFFAYVICTTFMLMHQNYLTQRSWSIAGLKPGAETGIVTQQALIAMVSAVVVVLVSSVCVVPVRVVGTHLSLASALRNLVDSQHIAGGSVSSTATDVSLSDDSTFQIGIGDGSSSSDQTVLTAAPSDHLPHYYIGRTYDTYDGNEWTSSLDDDFVNLQPTFDDGDVPAVTTFPLRLQGEQGSDESEPLLDSNGEPLVNEHVASHQFVTKFTVVGSSTQNLYVPDRTSSIILMDDSTYRIAQHADDNFGLNQIAIDGFLYRTVSVDLDPSPDDLRSAPTIGNASPSLLRQMYIDQRGSDVVSIGDQERLQSTVNQIIDTLPKDRRSEYDIAEAIREWVSRRCLYSLTVSPVPTGDDAVSYFLFNSRKGYCDLFASSMAILCRYAGIPSRVATGFDSGNANNSGGFDLRVMDKHAWVQVWFPGYGWQQFDPTEGSAQASDTTTNHDDLKWLRSVLGSIRLFFAMNGFLTPLLSVGTTFSLLYVAKIEIYDKIFRPLYGIGQIKSYKTLEAAAAVSASEAANFSKVSAIHRYQQFENVLRFAGLARPEHQTPLQFLATFRESLFRLDSKAQVNRDEVIQAATELTEDVMAASYAPIELVGESLIVREQEKIGQGALKTVLANSSALRKALKRDKKLAVRH